MGPLRETGAHPPDASPHAARLSRPAVPPGDRLAGLLVGGGLGDALGLPAEGLSRARLNRRWPGELRHRFVQGRGFFSDDTEHAFMTAQALLAAGPDVAAFGRALAWQLRWWFLALPAGVGLATARACLRLWLGFPPTRSGVASAGNGAAMRSPLLGAVFAAEPDCLHAFVEASTRLTHTDPRAATAALAVAEAAAWLVRGGADPEELFARVNAAGGDPEWRTCCQRLRTATEAAPTVAAFADALGLSRGVTGYAYHTVPVALFAWLRHRGDFRGTVASAVRCGGDTDTVAALAGALAGCDLGRAALPADWVRGLCDWPRSVAVLERAAARLAEPPGAGPVRWCWPGVLPRNAAFLALVLGHGWRRLLPPY